MTPAVGKKALGYLVEYDDRGIIREHDTFTCRHCNNIGIVQPFKDAEQSGSGAICYSCNGLICLKCLKQSRENGMRCDYIEKKLERQEKADAWWREYQSVTK